MLALFFSTWAFALDDLKFPTPAPVVDQFGLLDRDEVERLSNLLQKIKSQSGVEIAVYITDSLHGYEISEYSLGVAEAWKLGRRKEDKGLLYLIAPKEKKMRLEVGYGLEGELTDAFTRRVQDNIVRPYFKNGQYFEGILAGILALQEKIPLGVEQRPPQAPHGINWSLVFIILIILASMVVSFLQRLFNPGAYYRSRRGGWSHYGSSGGWGGGGWSSRGGGGSWGGGGGGFGGGGSSSSW